MLELAVPFLPRGCSPRAPAWPVLGRRSDATDAEEGKVSSARARADGMMSPERGRRRCARSCGPVVSVDCESSDCEDISRGAAGTAIAPAKATGGTTGVRGRCGVRAMLCRPSALWLRRFEPPITTRLEERRIVAVRLHRVERGAHCPPLFETVFVPPSWPIGICGPSGSCAAATRAPAPPRAA